MPEKSRGKIYLASPLGFAESTGHFMKELIEVLKNKGYDPINPWDYATDDMFRKIEAIDDRIQREEELNKADMDLARMNKENIEKCESMLAILDGVDVDSGTASEIGFAYAKGMKVYGYRGDFRQAGENDGVLVNLQVQYWIQDSGGTIFTKLKEIKEKF